MGVVIDSGMVMAARIKGVTGKLGGMTSNWSRFLEAAALVWEGIRFASTWHTFFMVVCTATATLFCAKGMLDFSFDFSMNIVAVGTIFPLVFSVQASFSRRERALAALAHLKGTIFATYLIFKTFDQTGDGQIAGEVEEIFRRLVDDIEWYMKSPHMTEAGHVVYDGFTAISLKIRDLLAKTGYSKPGEGGLSRLQVYLRDMMANFEEVRAVRDTETPVGLRLFCFALINVLPIVLAPYWLHFCDTDNSVASDNNRYGCQSAYFVAVAFVTIIVTLYRVQCELEDPFDGKGDDDVRWEEWRAQLDQLSSYGSDGPEKRDSMLLHHLNSAVS
mmetsp:Transcript_5568/g.13327  ORF Transcript_5568/g.13327 Transcript_5568/m.13327 type:complete len:331 (-) Transcript_5568:132-1124(-)